MSGEKFQKLLEIMAALRAPDGCPWDREQSIATLKPYLIEETYEVLDAIEREDWDHLAEELGDLQLQIVFQAQIAKEEGLFSIDDVVDAISEKLIRRHPHVFGNESGKESIDTAGGVATRWEEIKQAEKAAKGEPDEARSILDDVPRHQPGVLEANKLAKRAAKVGFDWREFEELVDKLHEETGEVREARDSGDQERIEDEVGDLLFMAVNVARHLRVNPELAIRRTNQKFRRRFAHIERALAEQGRTLEEASLDEMEELWQAAKRT